MAVPGKEEDSSTWKQKVPQMMDTGKDKRYSKAKLSQSWTSEDK